MIADKSIIYPSLSTTAYTQLIIKMVKRRHSGDELALKRPRTTSYHYQPQVSLKTADMIPRLVNQGIFEIVERIAKKITKYESKIEYLKSERYAELRKMLPTSDGRDMKYDHFTSVQEEGTSRSITYDQAIAKIKELLDKEECSDTERIFWASTHDEWLRDIERLEEEMEKLKGKLKKAKKGGHT